MRSVDNNACTPVAVTTFGAQDEMKHSSSYVLCWATVAASSVVPLICGIGLIVWTLVREHADVAAQAHGLLVGAGFSLLVFFCLGWPLAFALLGFFVFSTRDLIKRGSRSARVALVMYTTAVGALGVPLVWKLVWVRVGNLLQMSILGAIAGLACGTCFCVIAIHRMSPESSV